MKLGKTLWLIIAIKLFIMFAILKVFFFPNHIKQQTQKGSESEYISKELIQRSK
jgi:membrane protein